MVVFVCFFLFTKRWSRNLESTGWIGSAKLLCRQVACHSELRFCSGAGRKRNFNCSQCTDECMGGSGAQGLDGAARDWICRMGTSRVKPSSKEKKNTVLLPDHPWHSSCLLLTHIQVLMYSTSGRDAGLSVIPWSLQAACSCTHPTAHQGCAARARFPVSSPASFVTLGKSQRKAILIPRFRRLILTLSVSLHALKYVSLVSTERLGPMPNPGTLGAL